MTRITAWSSRALIAASMTTLALSTAAIAAAHVHVEADHPVRGDYAILTFEVPNESDTGALTTQLTVALPNVESASTEAMPGWTAHLDRDAAAGTVRSVSWSAAPGTGVAPDQFALFRVWVKLPNTDSASFAATQSYSDGTVVKWDQPTPPGGSEPEHPVPELKLAAESTVPQGPQAATVGPQRDATARWLAGVGIAVGAAGLVLALISRRRA
jgi:uncharacterized protein YcnI